MKKSKKEIEDILLTKPLIKDILESFITLAIVRPSKTKNAIEIYLENVDKWVQMPVSDIIDLEEIDMVYVNEELYKFSTGNAKVLSVRLKGPQEADHGTAGFFLRQDKVPFSRRLSIVIIGDRHIDGIFILDELLFHI